MTGRLEWPDQTEYLTPEEERQMEADRECQNCTDGRVLVFVCDGVCQCGMCPQVADCPECVGQVAIEDLEKV